jgi:SAM-dependent methyltransferase
MIVDWKEERNSFQDIARNWALGCPIAQQHREKLRIQAELIEKVCNKHESPTIVSLACGSCRDLEPIQRLIKKSKAKLILIDFDNDAIAEALSRLEFIRDQIEAHQTDIRRLPKLSRDLGAKADNIHLIYAGGLFDYLKDGIIKILLLRLSELIRPEGQLFFTNVVHNPYCSLIETIGNWKLIKRSEEDMKKILTYTQFERQDLKKDPTGLTWIAHATRGGKR